MTFRFIKTLQFRKVRIQWPRTALMTFRFTKALQSYSQNIAAISAELHGHPLYDQYYEAFGEQISGFIGVYELCVSMAEALTDWEAANGGMMAYENRDVTWIEVVEAFVDELLERSLATGDLLNPATVLRDTRIFQKDEEGA